MLNVIEERVTAHLETIESSYVVKILNKSEVAKWISDRIEDEKGALSIMTALNTWIMMNKKDGSLKIPLSILKQLHYNLVLKSINQPEKPKHR